jgi:hypothetical protein
MIIGAAARIVLTRNRKLVNQLLAEAKKLYDKDQETTVCVYVSDR